VQAAWEEAVLALRRRTVPTRELAAHVRLTKSPAEYLAVRAKRRELPYEAVLSAGREDWKVGEHVRVYRASKGRAGLVALPEDEAEAPVAVEDPRDYDVELYVRQLKETFAARLARALTPEDFAAVFADPGQPSLFAPALSDVQPILTVLDEAA
jgi:hypothetical protein